MAPPAADSSTASATNWARIWPLVAPSARRSPISERRSGTEITSVQSLDDLPVVAKLRVCVCLRVEGTGEAGDAHELHEFVDIRVVDQLLGRQAVGCYGGLPSYFDLK